MARADGGNSLGRPARVSGRSEQRILSIQENRSHGKPSTVVFVLCQCPREQDAYRA